MRITSLLFASLVTLGAIGCGGSSATSPTTTPGQSDDDLSCPVSVAGTSVTVEDTDRGAALVFVTTGDVAEVRKRVAAMATMHNDQHAAMGPLPTGDETGGGGHAGHDMGGDMGGMAHGEGGGEHAGHAGGMVTVHSRASVEEIDGGARLVFASMPGDVAGIQTELREHARHLSTGTCAMGHD